MKKCAKLVLLIGSLAGLVLFVYSQNPLQVGYAVLTADTGSGVPVGTALFSSTNAEGVLVWEAGVAAVEPISAGRIFVDQQGTSRTALALVNPSSENVTVTLILRNASGTEVDQKDEPFAPGQHRSLFVDELFAGLGDFTGSLTFQTQQNEEKVAAVTLRQNTNLQGEPIFATLPVVDLSAEPDTESIILPQVGAGQGLSTQLVLINSSEEAISGQIQLLDSQGAALELELDEVSGSSFPYQIEPDGIFSGELTSDSGTNVGYAVVTLEEGIQSPAGSGIFQFTSGDSVLSEAGVAVVTPTTSARIFVDNVGTRTGVAMASAGNPATTVTFQLLNINGSSLETTTRDLAAGGHLSVFADELFTQASEGFTGLMEITSPVPMAPVTLKLTSNERGQSILTTLPLVDLTQTATGGSSIFPQIGFGDFGSGAFATRLILIDQVQTGGPTGRLNFFQSDGSALTVPLGQETGSEFPYQITAGGGTQFRPGVTGSGSIAEIIIDPVNPSSEIVVNLGNAIQLAPIALDEEGNPLEGVDFSYTSLDTDVATIDAFGEIDGKVAGFSTLTVSSGEVIKIATITVVEVTSGVEGFEITGIAQDLARRLYLANTSNHTILLAQDLEAVPEVYAGVEQSAGFLNDVRLQSLFDNPAFLAFDQARGTLYVSDAANHVIRRVEPGPNGRVETLAGTGQAGDGDGPAAQARFNNPQGVALDDRGHLWVADAGNHTIRRINLATETVETVAGVPGSAGFADGQGQEARFNAPIGIAVEGETLGQELERQRTGAAPAPVSVVVADRDNGVIRRVREDGLVETVGLTLETTGQQQRASISLQREAILFASPEGVGVDPVGNIYVAEPENDRVSIILGGGQRGPTGGQGQGGGGVVPAAGPGTFDRPTGIAVPGDGEVAVGGRNNRRIDYGAPQISTIVPEQVGIAGGTAVEVKGRNFAADSLVVVAGVVIEDFDIQDSQTIRFTAPILPSGRTTLTVQNRGGLDQASLLVEAVPLNQLLAGQITTVAGGTTFSGDGSVAGEASLAVPTGVALDRAGNLLVADGVNNRIRKVDRNTGIITTVAGTGEPGFSGDGGPALAASLTFPFAVAVDAAGDLHIADTFNNRIRKVDGKTGTITTMAGSGCNSLNENCQLGDGGPATQATLFFPTSVALDGDGNLFIADVENNRIRKVNGITGIITTVAGTGEFDFSGDGGLATAAALASPTGIVVDGSGNLLIADEGNERIRRVNGATGIIITLAGGCDPFFEDCQLGDGGPAIAAAFSGPTTVNVDGGGNLFIADTDNNRIRKVDGVTGIITTVAGTGAFDFSGDGGPATAAALASPIGIVVDGAGNLLIADVANDRVRKVGGATNLITTVVGTGERSLTGDGVAATAAALIVPWGVAADGTGNLFIADTLNNRIRKVDGVTGIITTVAGTGCIPALQESCLLGDGRPAVQGALVNPQGVEVDEAGNLFIADRDNNRIRKVDGATGIITTVAGTDSLGFSGDGGPATTAELNEPFDVAVDGSGNLFIADTFNLRIRKVDATTGIITTVAGTGELGLSGDGGPAIAAAFSGPTSVAVDEAGNLFIADESNHRIRKVDGATGIITTVAGTGGQGYSGDGGPATSAMLFAPVGVAVDGMGSLFISDRGNGRVRKVDGVTGIITTVAGTGEAGLSGDGGPAGAAILFSPIGLTLDGAGNLFIADTGNSRIRAVRGPIP